MTFPQISIITPSLNRANFIKTAIESVVAQDYPSFEHILVDGVSTDGTLDVLAGFPHLRVVSASDRGVYDALNKGIEMAQGEIIGQLNSDDHYEPGIFSRIADCFAEHPEIDAICASARVYKISKNGSKETIAICPAIHPGELFYCATIGVPIINAWFFRKTIFKRIGRYTLEYPIVSDREFMFRIAKENIPFRAMEEIAYHYLQHDGSLTFTLSQEQKIHYMKEARMLAEQLLVGESSSSDAGQICRSWHADISGRLILKSLKAMNLSLLLESILKAFKQNVLWPLEFIKVRFLGKWKNRYLI